MHAVRNGWEGVSGPGLGNSRELAGIRPSRRHQGDPGAGLPHVPCVQPVLRGGAGGPRRENRVHNPCRPRPHPVRQQRSRSQRGSPQDGRPQDRAQQGPVRSERVPRKNLRIPRSHRPGEVPEVLRAAHQRRLPVLRAGRLRAGQEDGDQGHRSRHGGAHPGGGRSPLRAQGVLPDRPRRVHRQGRPDDLRRGPDRNRTHRRVVRHPELRGRSRHHYHGQGPRRRPPHRGCHHH